MKKIFFRLLFLLVLMGFSCPDIEEDVLSIVEGQVFDCSGEANPDPILIFTHSSFESFLADTIYPDNNGYFMHQFTSRNNIVYALPGDFDCSAASASPLYGHKTSVTLRQKTMFPALDLFIEIDSTQTDSFRLQIRRIGEDAYYDNLSFDSGITNNWDTLQKVYRLCQGCNYLMIATIQPNSQSAEHQMDTLRIQDQLIARTINF